MPEDQTRHRQRSYDAFLAPMEVAWFGKWRRRILKDLEGTVLDIGSGTGINLRYYPGNVDCVTVLDPDSDNLSFLEKKAERWGYGTNSGRCLNTQMGAGEELPFPSHSFDVVVSTLILCTVKDPVKVISEGARVLKKGGKFIFMEHQLPRKGPQAAIFNLISPVWHAPSGCNLNRNTEKMIRSNKKLKEIESFRGGPLLGYPFFIGSFEKK